MKKQTLVSLFILASVTTGCSSTRKSIGLGVVTGITTGAAFHHGSLNRTVKGLAIGAIVGGIASYFIHQGLEKRDARTRKETLFNLEKFGVYGQARASEYSGASPYSLSPTRIEQDYIETHVEDGRRLIEGHKVYTISEDSQWIPKRRNNRVKD
jgi:hypothetical protein